MEKKKLKLNINTAIYVMIGIMLAAMVLVTILTAALRNDSDEVNVSLDETAKAVMKKAETQKKETQKTETTREPETEADKNIDGSVEVNVQPEEPETAVSAGIRYYTLPVDGGILKNYEVDVPVYSMTMNDYRAHAGVDLAAELGTEVVSVENGTVCRVWNDPMMGKCVSIDHGDGIVSTYMNLAEETAVGIALGENIAQGQAIGTVGASALTEISEEPHLHLEMKVNGEFVDPIEYMGIDAVYTEYEG